MTIANVIFVDDDETLRRANRQSLGLAGFAVDVYADAASALAAIAAEFDGVVVSDIRMPDMDGLQMFKEVQKIDPDIPVILITGHGDVPMAVSALQAGVHDFLMKPFAADHLIASVRRAAHLRSLLLDGRTMQRAAELAVQQAPLIGDDPAMQRLRASVARIAAADVDVVLEGETGTGKALIARLLHRASRRRAKPFVRVSCSSAPGDVIEAELFGDTRSGSVRSTRAGHVEDAHLGTLYLDDVDHLSASAQSRLARVLDGGAIAVGGGAASRPVNVRVVAGCRGDLRQAVDARRFRDDLYYRLAVARLHLPPLRQRRSDILPLFAHFVREALPKPGNAWPEPTDSVRQLLTEHDWPGNARELKAFATRFALDLLDAEETSRPPLPLNERVRRFEEAEIRDALDRCKGDIGAATAMLQLPRKTLYDKLARHGITAATFRST